MSHIGFTQILCALTIVLAGCQSRSSSLDDVLGDVRIVDLTHSFDSTTVYWPTEEGFILEKGFAGITDNGFYYTANSFRSAEHGGTHLDAPVHFAEGRWTADEVPLESLIGPAVVVDASDSASVNRDYRVSVDDLIRWEREHGRLPKNAILLLNTGHSQYWPSRLRYLGTDATGAQAVPSLHFPGLDPEAARWLIANRSITAIGIDTPSIDYGQSTHFETHQILFESNVPALENVADPGRLPATGAWLFALPMKIGGGSGGPLRIAAVIPNAAITK